MKGINNKMGYLYKLVDKNSLKDARKNIITFSHPIFEFKGSEGKFINFAKRIYDRHNKKGLDLIPSKTDLKDIKKWCDIYKKTYGEEFNDFDINSESKLVFCGIMQGFCGYFTTVDLSDKTIKNEYLSKNTLKEKEAIIRINEKVFEHRHWRSDKVEGDYVKYYGDKDDISNYNGFMHPTRIIYSENYDDYNELLSIYNNDEIRRDASIWFKILSKKYEYQKEKRLIFLVESFEPNSSRTGCDEVYNPNDYCSSWEEVVFKNIVDAIHYCCQGPKRVSLKLDEGEIDILPL